MTTEEFKNEIEKLGLTIDYTTTGVRVKKYIEEITPYTSSEYLTIAFVDKNVCGVINTYVTGIMTLNYNERAKLVKLCTELALTDIPDRE